MTFIKNGQEGNNNKKHKSLFSVGLFVIDDDDLCADEPPEPLDDIAPFDDE